MKIESIESFCNEFVGFVRVTAEDGSQGWGQVSTYCADITAQVLHRQVAPWTLGQDMTDLDDLLAMVIRPTPHARACRMAAFRARLAAKDWLKAWPKLRVAWD